MGLQTDPEATQRPIRDRASGSTEGNGLLEPYEGQLSSTVLRGGGGGDAAPLPDTAARRVRDRDERLQRTGDVAAFRRGAARSVLQKPFVRAQLFSLVARVLES